MTCTPTFIAPRLLQVFLANQIKAPTGLHSPFVAQRSLRDRCRKYWHGRPLGLGCWHTAAAKLPAPGCPRGQHGEFSPVLPDVVPAPGSHNGVSLPLVRSLRSGFLHFPAASRCATSPGSISHTGRSFDWNLLLESSQVESGFLCNH